MDSVSWIGIVVALGGILLGQVLEGGHLDSIFQFTAGLIVFGGTLGAVLISSPIEDIKMAAKLFRLAFFDDETFNHTQIANELMESAQIARKESILSLEKRLSKYSNTYMQEVFRFIIDGIDPMTIREVFENDIALEEDRQLAGARVFTEAGGFAPTVGIIGAVLGLIHVMENLTDTSKLGTGIAVAFVATVYGVGSANILLIPFGNKLKRKILIRSETKAMILEGALGIVNGLNPYLIEQKLKSFGHTTTQKRGA
jgi:chemotaxis protein MotA